MPDEPNFTAAQLTTAQRRTAKKAHARLQDIIDIINRLGGIEKFPPQSALSIAKRMTKPAQSILEVKPVLATTKRPTTPTIKTAPAPTKELATHTSNPAPASTQATLE
ncbi:hypothetical protein MCOR05_003174 [Pyricularia oryzae]|nr:hypothetical protein MCOR05_003174 [Pyricularia oryzae]